jgi:hypothetical protein
MDLGDEGDVRACVVSLDGGAHAGATGTDDEDVVLGFHYRRTLSDLTEEARQTRGPAWTMFSSAPNFWKFSWNRVARYRAFSS